MGIWKGLGSYEKRVCQISVCGVQDWHPHHPRKKNVEASDFAWAASHADLGSAVPTLCPGQSWLGDRRTEELSRVHAALREGFVRHRTLHHCDPFCAFPSWQNPPKNLFFRGGA